MAGDFAPVEKRLLCRAGGVFGDGGDLFFSRPTILCAFWDSAFDCGEHFFLEFFCGMEMGGFDFGSGVFLAVPCGRQAWGSGGIDFWPFEFFWCEFWLFFAGHELGCAGGGLFSPFSVDGPGGCGHFCWAFVLREGCGCSRGGGGTFCMVAAIVVFEKFAKRSLLFGTPLFGDISDPRAANRGGAVGDGVGEILESHPISDFSVLPIHRMLQLVVRFA